MKQPNSIAVLPAQRSFMSWFSSARWRNMPEVVYPLSGLVIVCVLMGVTNHDFLSVDNAMTILRQVSINMIIAIGMTFVILTGGIDLSVGSVMALTGTIDIGTYLGTCQSRPCDCGGTRCRLSRRSLQRSTCLVFLYALDHRYVSDHGHRARTGSNL